jgi:hypothetical protein
VLIFWKTTIESSVGLAMVVVTRSRSGREMVLKKLRVEIFVDHCCLDDCTSIVDQNRYRPTGLIFK